MNCRLNSLPHRTILLAVCAKSNESGIPIDSGGRADAAPCRISANSVYRCESRRIGKAKKDVANLRSTRFKSLRQDVTSTCLLLFLTCFIRRSACVFEPCLRTSRGSRDSGRVTALLGSVFCLVHYIACLRPQPRGIPASNTPSVLSGIPSFCQQWKR